MQDNGKGTLRENRKIVKSGAVQRPTQSGTLQPKGEYFLIDNPDPAHLIQRVEIHGDSITVIDNLPIEEAKKIFEEELKKTQEPIMVDLKAKAQQVDYQPTDTEIARLVNWLSKPNTFLDEGHLQKMYDFPEGSVWDFFLHALGKKKIPTPKERIEKNYLSYLNTYNFTDDQILVLRKIKDVFASNVASKREIDEMGIFANPIYERLIGSYDEVNKKFNGNFSSVINDLKTTFRGKPSA